MKINIWDALVKSKEITEDIILKDIDLTANYSLKAINPFTLHVTFDTYDEVVEVHLAATITLILECAYTLELFPYEIKLDDELCFNYKNKDIEAEDDECFYEKGPHIDLEPYLFGLILSYVPLRAIKPGAKRPESGEGYNVMSEDEYEDMREKNLPFAPLEEQDE